MADKSEKPARDPRGFTLKFYTDEGNWDMVGDNTPVFFVRDGLKFGDFIHSQKQGIKNLSAEQAEELAGKDPDYARRDLWEAIERRDYPKWRVCIQAMPEADAETYHINPFDLTKIWSRAARRSSDHQVTLCAAGSNNQKRYRR